MATAATMTKTDDTVTVLSYYAPRLPWKVRSVVQHARVAAGKCSAVR